ncbi:MAG: shikimate kinase [Bacteroidota bacterium]|nr:shikimate kinase [Bacteroidota bacterium]
MSSGKTYWGKQVSQKLDMPFFDLDGQVVVSEGKSINEIFEKDGEEYFRQKEKEVLHILTESRDTFVIACGGGTPCYYNNIDYMNRSGVTVWINTPMDILFERLQKQRAQRPLLRKLTDEQLKGFIIKKFSDRKIYYEQAKVIVDDETILVDSFVEKIFNA